MAKPDNRADNVPHLQKAIQNTLKKKHATEEYLEEFGDEIPTSEMETLLEKNERRQAAVEKFRSEVKDEAHS
ncbi:small acid-soluble spore protein Tlp [Paenibacillus sp.]|uniref:small acid-soluble spore protein Tlp n=1 Tax=Paenibacillus sp. TaxID=58172 RepID=UPI002D5A2BAB|nr:small acid-soluble spore protein Tlp [Paenibacillus sp.]HZG56993.1 small acid-soluble spore protein Tlp [Paenibacillus sp.]